LVNLRWRGRLEVWLRRYLPAELLSLPAGFIGGMAGSALFDSLAAAAAGATLGEVSGFYCSIIARDLHANAGLGRLRGVVVTARNAVLEFGPAEWLDTLVIRPAALMAALTITGNLLLGLAIGKLVADALFYAPTVVAFELRTRMLPVHASVPSQAPVRVASTASKARGSPGFRL